ncbi:MAG: MFS transporter [Lentisphaeria bacterium]|nr:MFS transporter [Lentisphaeria bacterium]
MSERRKLLILYICGIALYFFTNLQRSGIPGSLFNELQSGLALTAAQVTMLGTCFIYIYTFNQLIAGVLNDRYGGIRMMIFGAVFFCLGSVLFPLTGSVWGAYGARLITGFGASFMYLAMVKLSQRLFPETFPQMVGIILLLGYMGNITANAPLSWLAADIGWRNALLTAGVLTTAIFVFFVLLRRTVTLVPIQDVKINFQVYKDFWKIKHNRWMCIYCASNFSFYFIFQVIIGKKFLEDFCAVSGSTAAMSMSVMALFAAVSGIICAFLSKALHNRRRCFIRVTGTYSAVALALLTGCVLTDIHSPWLLLPVILFGFTGNLAPITVALLSETNPPEKTAIAVSFSNFASYFGVSIGGSCVGFLMEVAAPQRIGDILVYGKWSYAAVLGFLLLLSLGALRSVYRIRETYGKNIYSTIE